MLKDQTQILKKNSCQNSGTHNDTTEFVKLTTGTSAKTLISRFHKIHRNINQKHGLKT